MKEKLKELYESGVINQTGLVDAVKKNWITIEQAAEIVGEDNASALIKEAKLAELSAICNTVIVSGFDITLNEETIHFNLSTEDQSNINNLFRVVELGGTQFPYQSEGGNCRVYSAEEIVKIYIASQTHITTQLTYHNELKSYVNSLETAEEVSAVQYGMTLPDAYLAEMQEKLAVAQGQMESIVTAMSGKQDAAAETA